jgi:hypothetical protein
MFYTWVQTFFLPDFFEKQQLIPGTFWSLAKNKHQDLSTIAKKLLNLSATTAQLERIYSN